MSDEYRTAHVGEIRDHFRCDTMGDAWALILERDWDSYQPPEGGRWTIYVPMDEWLVAEA